MKKIFLLAAVTAAALASASGASATILVATYTGLVTNGYDQSGLFGAAGADLTNDAYVAIYTFDTTKGNYGSGGGSGYSYEYQQGGTCCGAATPVSAQVTINGFTQSLAGNDYGYAYDSHYSYGAGFTSQLLHFVRDITDDGHNYVNNQIFNTAFDISNVAYNVPIALTAFDNSYNSGNAGAANFTTYNYDSITQTIYTNVNFGAGTVVVTEGGVPEPASWALMIGGFGLVGASLRRRRASLAA